MKNLGLQNPFTPGTPPVEMHHLDTLVPESRKGQALESDMEAVVERLLSDRARLEATVLAMPDPVVVTDPGLRIELTNVPFQSAFGVSGAAVLGRPFGEAVVHAEMLAALSLVRDDPEATDQIWFLSLPGEGARKTARHYELKITRVVVDGHLVGMVAMLDEVTRYRELNDLKNDFVNTVSHQFRTPLASLLLNASTLLDGYSAPGGQVSEGQKELLQSIIDETQRLNKMVGELLALSRLESGNVRLDRSRTDLHRLMALGVLHEMGGETTEARRLYRAALALDPSYRAADNNLTRMVQLSPGATPFDLGDADKDKKERPT